LLVEVVALELTLQQIIQQEVEAEQVVIENLLEQLQVVIQ
jgi:hypothetical protein